MIGSIIISLAALLALVILLRQNQLSLGLPVAYLFGLFWIHVPGAVAHSFPWSKLLHSDFTATGIRFTAIGACCFVVGVWIARGRIAAIPLRTGASRREFWLFCLLAGWFVLSVLNPLFKIPSFGAALENGAAVWMLGVMLGLQAEIRQCSAKAFFWVTAMFVYPVLMLLLGGFLSYGFTAITICLGPLVISVQSRWRLAVGFALISILGVNLFLSYFQNRQAIRKAVWGGADLAARVDASRAIFVNLRWFDPSDRAHLRSLDERLNQNYFVGLAADRLERGWVDYLKGRSVWEGALALVPRAIWPDKPVYGGSPGIVSEMTGLKLSATTSFGIGNVMEFYINFGMTGLVIGFVLLGWAIGYLDLAAAQAERAGNLPKLFRCFLPAVALIQPNGSIVELCGGSGAAWLSALGWGCVWAEWSSRSLRDGNPLRSARHPARGREGTNGVNSSELMGTRD